jgi:hypothetical protein
LIADKEECPRKAESEGQGESKMTATWKISTLSNKYKIEGERYSYREDLNSNCSSSVMFNLLIAI